MSSLGPEPTVRLGAVQRQEEPTDDTAPSTQDAEPIEDSVGSEEPSPDEQGTAPGEETSTDEAPPPPPPPLRDIFVLLSTSARDSVARIDAQTVTMMGSVQLAGTNSRTSGRVSALPLRRQGSRRCPWSICRFRARASQPRHKPRRARPAACPCSSKSWRGTLRGTTRWWPAGPATTVGISR